MVLGFCWVLLRHFRFGLDKDTSFEDALLKWVKEQLVDYPDIAITNFKTSCALPCPSPALLPSFSRLKYNIFLFSIEWRRVEAPTRFQNRAHDFPPLPPRPCPLLIRLNSLVTIFILIFPLK